MDDEAILLAKYNASDARTAYNDAMAKYNEAKAVADALLIDAQIKLTTARAAQARVADLINEHYMDPEFPAKPWTQSDLKYVFVTKAPIIQLAIAVKHGVNDVTKTLDTLRATFAEQPELLGSMLGLTRTELAQRYPHEDISAVLVCDECFTTPHQISCSRSDS